MPHISDDGSKVVFTKIDPNSAGDVVCFIKNNVGATENCLDFSSSTPVLKGANLWHASWAPHDSIVFEAWGGPLTSDEIFMANEDGTGLTQITNNAGTNNYDECPSVSSDGARLVVDTWNDSAQHYEIALIDLNTKQRASIGTTPYGVAGVGDAWDPLYTLSIVWVSQLKNDPSEELYFMSFSPLRMTKNTYADYFEKSPW